MGSVGNPNPWSPYDNFKDCSLQICSIYCPQFCYFIFPPPPPDDDDDSSAPFSPLIIAIIAVLSSAFLLVSYYTIVTRFCRRRRQSGTPHNPEDEEIINNHENAAAANHDQWQVGSAGLDESVIKTIPFCKYVKGGALIDGTECAVCLSEFREGECLRLLPKCSHAFHLPCVDTWLKSHSNCPLCRAGVSPAHDAVDLDDRSDDLVLTVVDDGGGDGEEDGGVSDHDEGSNVKRVLRRSVSLDDFTVGPRVLILKIDGDEGSWRGIMGNSSKGSEMRRSVSTGRIP